MIPLVIRRRESDLRYVYVREHPLALTMATITAAVGVYELLEPTALAATFVGQGLPTGTGRPWAMALALGGVLVLVGTLRLSPRSEAAGWALLASAYALAALAVCSVRGWPSCSFSASTYMGLGIGSALRAYTRATTTPIDPARLRRDTHRS